MITRRGLFRGLLATAAVLAFKPFAKAEEKKKLVEGDKINWKEVDNQLKEIKFDNWKDLYLGNWPEEFKDEYKFYGEQKLYYPDGTVKEFKIDDSYLKQGFGYFKVEEKDAKNR